MWIAEGSLAAILVIEAETGLLAHSVGVQELCSIARYFQRSKSVAVGVMGLNWCRRINPRSCPHGLKSKTHFINDPHMHGGIQGDLLCMKLSAQIGAKGLNGLGIHSQSVDRCDTAFGR